MEEAGTVTFTVLFEDKPRLEGALPTEAIVGVVKRKES
jgi:hypothetical protein